MEVGAVGVGAGACVLPGGAGLFVSVLCLFVVTEGTLFAFGAGPFDVVHAVWLPEPWDGWEWYCYLLS